MIECSSTPVVINPLSVAIQSSEKRLILDLRYPNSFLNKFRISFEDAKTMINLLVNQPLDWLFLFYIKSGYHHIEIFPEDQQFFRLFARN